ncbi:MAG: hypothetical protein U9N45_00890, partial [Gemmatimonadota bacterium]|nr:hypothetical protein [Gemmatimonadota bacterium]
MAQLKGEGLKVGYNETIVSSHVRRFWMQMTNARVIFLIVVSLVLVVFPACQGREEVSGEKAFPPARTEEKVLL